MYVGFHVNMSFKLFFIWVNTKGHSLSILERKAETQIVFCVDSLLC